MNCVYIFRHLITKKLACNTYENEKDENSETEIRIQSNHADFTEYHDANAASLHAGERPDGRRVAVGPRPGRQSPVPSGKAPSHADARDMVANPLISYEGG